MDPTSVLNILLTVVLLGLVVYIAFFSDEDDNNTTDQAHINVLQQQLDIQQKLANAQIAYLEKDHKCEAGDVTQYCGAKETGYDPEEDTLIEEPNMDDVVVPPPPIEESTEDPTYEAPSDVEVETFASGEMVITFTPPTILQSTSQIENFSMSDETLKEYVVYVDDEINLKAYQFTTYYDENNNVVHFNDYDSITIKMRGFDSKRQPYEFGEGTRLSVSMKFVDINDFASPRSRSVRTVSKGYEGEKTNEPPKPVVPEPVTNVMTSYTDERITVKFDDTNGTDNTLTRYIVTVKNLSSANKNTFNSSHNTVSLTRGTPTNTIMFPTKGVDSTGVSYDYTSGQTLSITVMYITSENIPSQSSLPSILTTSMIVPKSTTPKGIEPPKNVQTSVTDTGDIVIKFTPPSHLIQSGRETFSTEPPLREYEVKIENLTHPKTYFFRTLDSDVGFNGYDEIRFRVYGTDSTGQNYEFTKDEKLRVSVKFIGTDGSMSEDTYPVIVTSQGFISEGTDEQPGSVRSPFSLQSFDDGYMIMTFFPPTNFGGEFSHYEVHLGINHKQANGNYKEADYYFSTLNDPDTSTWTNSQTINYQQNDPNSPNRSRIGISMAGTDRNGNSYAIRKGDLIWVNVTTVNSANMKSQKVSLNDGKVLVSKGYMGEEELNGNGNSKNAPPEVFTGLNEWIRVDTKTGVDLPVISLKNLPQGHQIWVSVQTYSDTPSVSPAKNIINLPNNQCNEAGCFGTSSYMYESSAKKFGAPNISWLSIADGNNLSLKFEPVPNVDKYVVHVASDAPVMTKTGNGSGNNSSNKTPELATPSMPPRIEEMFMDTNSTPRKLFVRITPVANATHYAGTLSSLGSVKTHVKGDLKTNVFVFEDDAFGTQDKALWLTMFAFNGEAINKGPSISYQFPNDAGKINESRTNYNEFLSSEEKSGNGSGNGSGNSGNTNEWGSSDEPIVVTPNKLSDIYNFNNISTGDMIWVSIHTNDADYLGSSRNIENNVGNKCDVRSCYNNKGVFRYSYDKKPTDLSIPYIEELEIVDKNRIRIKFKPVSGVSSYQLRYTGMVEKSTSTSGSNGGASNNSGANSGSMMLSAPEVEKFWLETSGTKTLYINIKPIQHATHYYAVIDGANVKATDQIIQNNQFKFEDDGLGSGGNLWIRMYAYRNTMDNKGGETVYNITNDPTILNPMDDYSNQVASSEPPLSVKPDANGTNGGSTNGGSTAPAPSSNGSTVMLDAPKITGIFVSTETKKLHINIEQVPNATGHYAVIDGEKISPQGKLTNENHAGQFTFEDGGFGSGGGIWIRIFAFIDNTNNKGPDISYNVTNTVEFLNSPLVNKEYLLTNNVVTDGVVGKLPSPIAVKTSVSSTNSGQSSSNSGQSSSNSGQTSNNTSSLFNRDIPDVQSGTQEEVDFQLSQVNEITGHGGTAGWSPWGPCQGTYPTGTRTRGCLDVTKGCDGSYMESCSLPKPEPRTAGWGPWGECINNTRMRQCLDAGLGCDGSAVDATCISTTEYVPPPPTPTQPAPTPVYNPPPPPPPTNPTPSTPDCSGPIAAYNAAVAVRQPTATDPAGWNDPNVLATLAAVQACRGW